MAKSAAQDQLIGAVRYTVREGAGGQVRIQKWRAGHGKEATYIVEPKGWWQRCSCPAHAVCKHQRLVNLIDSGRLGHGPYVWDGTTWRVVDPRVEPQVDRGSDTSCTTGSIHHGGL